MPENLATGDMPVPPDGWRAVLNPIWRDAGCGRLRAFLADAMARGETIYPPAPLWFAALAATPLARVRAVILGQDPYHGPGQAHGLAFSVPPGRKAPPSLRNILKERERDLGLPMPDHFCLSAWAAQGVLLLNRVLTVTAEQPASHAGQGWEHLTRAAIRAVSDRPGHAAFVLWGSHAAVLRPEIDADRHLIVQSAHPSPLSARRGFFGSRPFSAINRFLIAHDQIPIDWSLGSARGA